jgi:molybdopterin-guanine dinucleotide biosynthesis protein A
VATALRAATDDLLLVANDPAADEWVPGVPRIPDVRRGVGPLAGIHAALASGAEAILVVAWDMPFVEPALLTHLRRQGGADVSAVVPESAPGQLEPTCALYMRECAKPLEEWLDSGRSGAAAFLSAHTGVRRLPAADVSRFGDPARLFLSVDTPAALRQADALAAR